MRVEYKSGDIIVELTPCKLISKIDKPLYNRRGRYIRTESTYNFSATYNPGYTNAKIVNQRVKPDRNFNPFDTEIALRHYLEQPRKQFRLYDDDDNLIIASPEDNRDSDSYNGPFPTVHSIKEVVGSGSILIEWSITIHLNEVSKFTNEPILLEHEWDVKHDLDDRYYVTRIITGRATFNGSYLENSNLVPDDFRKYLFPPPPNGYKRINIDISAQEDGCALAYVLVDREQRCSLKRSGIAKVELIHKGGVKSPSFGDMVYNGSIALNSTVEAVGRAILAGFTGARASGGAAPPGNINVGSTQFNAPAAAQASGGISSIQSNAASFIRNNLPIRYSTVLIRVYGTSETPMTAIKSAAFEIATYRLGNLQVRELLRNVDIAETHIVHEGVVELSITHISGIGQQAIELFGNAGAAGGTLGNVNNLVIPDSTIEPSIAEWSYSPPVAGASTALRDNGSRGASLLALASQALQDATSRPSRHSSRIRDRINQGDPQG